MTREELINLHKLLCATAEQTMRAKNIDYSGGTEDPFANFRGSVQFGVHPAVGIMVRVNDKFMRIQSFLTNGKLAVKEESWRDCIMDSINYLVLLAGMLEEEASKGSLIVGVRVNDQASPYLQQMSEELKRAEGIQTMTTEVVHKPRAQTGESALNPATPNGLNNDVAPLGERVPLVQPLDEAPDFNKDGD